MIIAAFGWYYWQGILVMIGIMAMFGLGAVVMGWLAALSFGPAEMPRRASPARIELLIQRMPNESEPRRKLDRKLKKGD